MLKVEYATHSRSPKLCMSPTGTTASQDRPEDGDHTLLLAPK